MHRALLILFRQSNLNRWVMALILIGGMSYSAAGDILNLNTNGELDFDFAVDLDENNVPVLVTNASVASSTLTIPDVTFDIGVRDGTELTWANPGSWDNPALHLLYSFRMTKSIGGIFLNWQNPVAVVKEVENMWDTFMNGGPTETTLSIDPISIALDSYTFISSNDDYTSLLNPAVTTFNLSFPVSTLVKWNVSVAGGRDILLNQNTKLVSLDIANSGIFRVDDGYSLTVEDGIMNEGLFLKDHGTGNFELISSVINNGTFEIRSGTGVLTLPGNIDNSSLILVRGPGSVLKTSESVTAAVVGVTGSGSIEIQDGALLELNAVFNGSGASYAEISNDIYIDGASTLRSQNFGNAGTNFISADVTNAGMVDLDHHLNIQGQLNNSGQVDIIGTAIGGVPHTLTVTGPVINSGTINPSPPGPSVDDGAESEFLSVGSSDSTKRY